VESGLDMSEDAAGSMETKERRLREADDGTFRPKIAETRWNRRGDVDERGTL